MLGAGLNPDGSPSAFLAGRLEVAKALYDSGRARVILVSGDNRVANHDEPTAMRDWLVAEGVPADAVVRDFAGRDTYDSRTRAKRIFGVERALVVLEGYHLPRAATTCRAVGLDAEGVGDWTAEVYPAQWTAGDRREKLAAAKTVLDVVSGRDPVLGPVETSVQQALLPRRPWLQRATPRAGARRRWPRCRRRRPARGDPRPSGVGARV